jgi:hypothetical protein
MTIEKIIVEPFSYGTVLIFFGERVPLHFKSKKYELTDKNSLRKYIYKKYKKHNQYVNLGTIVMIPCAGAEIFFLSPPKFNWSYCLVDCNNYSSFSGHLKRLYISQQASTISILICQDLVKKTYSAICSFDAEEVLPVDEISYNDNKTNQQVDKSKDDVEHKNETEKIFKTSEKEFCNCKIFKNWCIRKYIDIIRRYIQRIGTPGLL